jgi:predicted amidohydrolase
VPVLVAALQLPVEAVAEPADLRGVADRCVRRGVDLLLTPEFAIGGLPHTERDAKRRAVTVEQLQASATSLPRGLTVVLGFTDRAPARLFSSAAVITAGRVVHVARKVFPREPGLSAGDLAPVIQIGGIAVGILICSDATHPELAATLARGGAQVLLCPLNNDMSEAHADQWEEPTHTALRMRAREARCWVVSADVAGVRPGRRALGATRIVSPTGRTVAEAGGPLDVVVAELA